MINIIHFLEIIDKRMMILSPLFAQFPVILTTLSEKETKTTLNESLPRLAKINFFDKFNAEFVSLITPEMPGLKKLRKQNNYNSATPTFEKPFEMQLEYIKIQNIEIRMAKSILATDKPNIILLSAFPHSILAYSPIWEILKSDFNVYAYDMPGFGMSETSDEFMTFEFQGNFLNSFIQHLDIKNPHIVAPDVGMPTAISYIGNHKHQVQSLMIGDGPAILPASNASIIKKMAGSTFWRLIFTIVGSGPLVASGFNLCNVTYVPNKYEISDFKKSYKGKVGNNMKWFQRYAESLPEIDAILGKIKVPTKVFWGKHDAIIFSKDAQRIHEKIPKSELEIFENSGHSVYLDEYENFAKMIAHYVNSNS